MKQESVPPSLGSCALRLSTTLFPKAATASTREKQQKERQLERGRAPRFTQRPRSRYSRVGKIFRITTRSATLCPVVMVPFL